MGLKRIFLGKEINVKKILVLIGVFFFLLIQINSDVYAALKGNDSTTEPVDVIMENGIITFRTTDTKATTSIRWKTVGFTVLGKTCNTRGDPSYNGGEPNCFKTLRNT